MVCTVAVPTTTLVVAVLGSPTTRWQKSYRTNKIAKLFPSPPQQQPPLKGWRSTLWYSRFLYEEPYSSSFLLLFKSGQERLGKLLFWLEPTKGREANGCSPPKKGSLSVHYSTTASEGLVQPHPQKGNAQKFPEPMDAPRQCFIFRPTDAETMPS